MGDQLKTIGFATLVCLVCSLLLSAVSSVLKEDQDRNKANDMRVKVLTALGVDIFDEKGKVVKTKEEIEDIFKSQIEEIVLDQDGRPSTTKKMDELTDGDRNDRDKETKLKKYYPLYIYTDSESGKRRYAIHVSGMGLWSVIKGFLALEDDMSTIAGISFYEHGETPGLGGEIEKDFFQSDFLGKTFLEDGEVQTFRVLKPGAKGDNHSVDGITAATMTCNGMTVFLNSDFSVYNKYFLTLR